MDDCEPPQPRPLSRQPECPARECEHEHHPFFPCERCGCAAYDPFGVIEE